jgi:hypothetical protein
MRNNPVFIVGCERSGTTLLRLMLNAHPQMAIPPESYFIQQIWAAHPSPKVYPPEIRERVIHLLLEHPLWGKVPEWGLDPEALRRRLESMEAPKHAKVLEAVFTAYAARQGKSRWGDKTPSYVESLDSIHQIFPKAKLIHLIRDGRAVCESLLRQKFGPGSVPEIGKLWSERVQRGRRAGRQLPETVYREISYEALVSEPEVQLRRLCSFLELSFHREMLEHRQKSDSTVFEEEKDGRHQSATRPIDPELRDQWRRRLSVSDRLLFQAFAGPTLRACGYPVERDLRQPIFTLWKGGWFLARVLGLAPRKIKRWYEKRTNKKVSVYLRPTG